jgi:hypothetical protein
MLSKLFSKRQKTEPLPEKPTGNCRMVSEEDMQRYEFQEKLFQTTLLFDKFPQRINDGFHHAGHDLLPVTETPVNQAFSALFLQECVSRQTVSTCFVRGKRSQAAAA